MVFWLTGWLAGWLFFSLFETFFYLENSTPKKKRKKSVNSINFFLKCLGPLVFIGGGKLLPKTRGGKTFVKRYQEKG
jgi:hypothetical protein